MIKLWDSQKMSLSRMRPSKIKNNSKKDDAHLNGSQHNDIKMTVYRIEVSVIDTPQSGLKGLSQTLNNY
jgi:hypothetical protein